MNRSLLRFATVALIPAAALSLNFAAVAQAPPATPPAATTPSTQTPAQAPVAPATPSPATPAPPAAPAPSAATPAAPVTPPVVVETPAPVAPAPVTPPPAVQAADPFGEEITLAPKQVLAFSGKANWDSAFETLMDAFKQMTALLDKQSIKPSGNPMIVYTSTDDTGFTFLAEIPVDQEPKGLPKAMSVSKSPEGRALKFVHRGSYDNMDNTYEAITNHLDDKKLEAKDTFIEEYMTDPLKTAEDRLVINVYVPLK
ncbi:GyrI-like domain-containing protein [Tardiphaga sp. vice352]|uniref:GyrI-like domain-containing protein n=1 Tax=unclassified Tardiphaga TaxID=2631404 RepID=UPI001164E335|nr:MULTISPECIES: GyrI-like domain-containing protein [unclassified Tardiphaga]QDM14954.1 GyrI-like domain-containing protein [Tardiphaga sp. vice278]QDM25134.1 GyrI-like domain-containing protein [Tardiphaga sp. vice304]QDM30345.1 GyrI-like domain-containing protein [Tardiphaga sp. vice352]